MRSQLTRPTRCRDRFRPLVLVLLVLVGGLTFIGTGHSHDLFNAYIQHRVALTVGNRHVDVTVQLTFFEDSSEHEREHMDRNGDGRVTRNEIEAYIQEFEPDWAKAVSLRVGDRRLSLIPLREPEIDLLGNDGVGRGHHRLTLHFFVPTPDALRANVELVVENRLWPEARALASLRVEGRDCFRVESLAPSDPVHPPARGAEAREFRARILSAPDPGAEPSTQRTTPCTPVASQSSNQP